MNDFKFYLPITKSAFPSGSYEKISETTKSGEIRTRFKIKGIASTTSLDRDNEIVSAICLKKMEDQINKKKLPIFGNHDHNWESMLGYTNTALASDNKLEISMLTDYVETNPRVMQLAGGLESGMPFALSIGGKVITSNPRKNKNGSESKILDDVDLFETSVVGIGANPDAFLSLPDQIAKSMNKNIDLIKKIRHVLVEEGSDKGELYLSDKTIKEIISVIEKNSGQLGMTDYGKLGETTIASNCPSCGKPSDLRMVDDVSSHYQCSVCDLHFDVRNPVKEMIGLPISQPINPSAETIDNQRQSVPGLKSNQEKKGDLMVEKEAEAEAKCRTAAEDEEKEYNEKFLKFLKRAITEGVLKAEGVSTTPGGENANPKNTIGGSGGAAAPVHQKSLAGFEAMKKAFHEEAGAEAFSNTKVETQDYSFAGIKKMLVRK